MEQSLGQDSIPSSRSFDKSRVLDVKPLRTLVPVFPSAPNFSSFSTPQGPAPFVCASPSGPFPPGFSPFYPFVSTSENQKLPEQDPLHNPSSVPDQNVPFDFNNPISNAVPINSFRTPPPSTAGATPIRQTGPTNGGTGSSRRVTRSRSAVIEVDEYGTSQNQSSSYLNVNDVEDTTKAVRPKGRSQKRTRASGDIVVVSPDVNIDLLVDKILTSFNDTCRKSDGDRETVVYILMVYDLFRRRLSQIEEAKEANPGIIRRPDLKAGTLFLSKGVRTNIQKRIGAVPGVEVGDIFFFRMELCLVGIHSPSMAGIDYVGGAKNSEEEPLAVSIVSSGGYEDYAEDADVLVYSGQGGNAGSGRKDKEITDQKLERGNLALERSLHRANNVRVIRGIKDLANPTGKIYVYDGLYKIHESWTEKGKGGNNVFKYKLVRLPGQPEAFAVWKSIEKWRGDTSRIGVILPDLTSGAENVPVSLVNDVDNEKGPAHFTYISSLKYSKPVNITEPSAGCICIGGCLPGNSNCLCIQKNNDWLPYTANGYLVNQKSLVHECGFSCQCPPNCRNRVSQSGLKIRLEVFKTKDRGWGLRSWDPIRAGSFICEYAGEVIDHSKVDELLVGEIEDDYIFDATRSRQPVGVLPGDSVKDQKIPFPLTISAKYFGNVARFMNHSCSPNVLWQPVLRENKSESDLHIAFYAIRHIPPLTELTYDYGMVPYDKGHRDKKCLCGSSKCRGFFH
ncbi:histone-lysine N-methyltransferase, H3 lysine-9 specific SUVH1 [Ziziphus jujuba]|uniref:Histone-lysine N-methyltransferase, H3 lysine-9 specific SUVH1 n=1 Tax=Ziziphus jujuba TaxID=326968 RepID=A0A6P3ZJA0_ZIZJJ|nr:histone-lysine N-methyltransferase, H3 lysine-9 specific SUVH1 [Ziziphus jujuba]XP_048322123.2 histone-lysine N-methyltransferase, H3 lysine-9 specific SUVH1 [Ziziphus jujuba]XP_048322124.2 histone-lysine N-methyltransferase, H3 lysine-9 specific SUVH1 [Ziziphus jujuba]XP_048322125.2 histone-lysine N-methyltransferase, H3 lysine-9 specific SUVH1 [Ziziphus jujuba]